MFAAPHRQKGGAPQLGAKGPHQRGPFGPWVPEGDDGGGLDDVQATVGNPTDDQDHDDT